MDIAFNDLGKVFPKNYGMPVRMVGHLCTVLQSIATLCCGQCYSGHTLVSIIIPNVRLSPDITYKHHFIHTNYLFPITKIFEMEVLSLWRGELTPAINYPAKMVNNTVITI